MWEHKHYEEQTVRTILDDYREIYENYINNDSLDSKMKKLLEVNLKMLSCNRCPLSKEDSNIFDGRKKGPCFGYGSPHAKVFIIGEAPSYLRKFDDEMCPFNFKDFQFFGNLKTYVMIGGILGNVFFEAVKKTNFKYNTDFYVHNLIQCSIMNNRKPTKEEILSCIWTLNEEFSILKPMIVVTFGTFVTSIFLSIKSISEVIGKLYEPSKSILKYFDHKNFKIFPMHHPNFVYRKMGYMPEYIKEIENLNNALNNIEKSSLDYFF